MAFAQGRAVRLFRDKERDTWSWKLIDDPRVNNGGYATRKEAFDAANSHFLKQDHKNATPKVAMVGR